MTKGNYIRLDAFCGCGNSVKMWSGRGRKPTRCDECSNPKQNSRPSAKVSKACECCGVLMPPAPPSRVKRFCSIQCVGKSQRKHPEWKCAECGVMFSRRPGGSELRDGRSPTYCSTDCRSKGWVGRTKERKKKEREEKERKAAISRIISLLKKRASKLMPPEDGKCESCGVTYKRVKWQRKGKCLECAETSQEHIKERRKIREKEYRKTKKGRAARFASKARRRSRERINAVPVDPIEILERDNWICQLCGVKTPKSKRGSYDDNAPELDHIVSLADGGGHAPNNLQCACRSCNLLKGRQSRGQLWLA